MYLLVVTPWLPDINFMDGWACIFGFNYGPLLYLYTISLIYRDFHFRAYHLLHFLPTFFLSALTLSDYPICGSFGWMIYLSLITYLMLILIQILHYRKVVKQTQSTSLAVDLKWLQWTVIIFSLILFADILDQYLFSMDIVAGISIVHLILLFLVNSMFFRGIRQPQIFQGISKEDAKVINTPSSDHNNQDEQEVKRVLAFIEENESFLSPELSLKELADALGMSPRKLSYLINQYLGQNFMSFINSKRIEKAKQILTSNPDAKLTILEIMC